MVVNKSIKKNAVYNVIRRMLTVIFPLITYPYATRVLGADSLGKVNYTYSIINYFTLLATFGVTSYGAREGAKYRDNSGEFNRFTKEVFSVNVFFSLASFLALSVLAIVWKNDGSYSRLLFLQSGLIFFTALGVDWINVVYEDYAYITIRSLSANIITLVFLFIFVKDKNDYLLYSLLPVISNGVICLSNLYYCRRYAQIKVESIKKAKNRIKPMSIFFVNELTVSIYVNADTTMLGIMTSDYNVGIYSVAVKIYTIIKTIFAAIYSVALSRLTYYFSKEMYEEYKKLLTEIVSVLFLLLIPGALGLLLLSSEISIIIGGSSFASSAYPLRILSAALIFAILGGIASSCINLSMGLEKINLRATIYSAIINIVLNIPCILLLKENGAALTTALSELFVFLYCIKKNKNAFKYIELNEAKKNFIFSMVGCLCVALVCTGGRLIVKENFIRIIFDVVISAVLYFAILLAFKNTLAISIISKIKKKK
jgi:O-antigen/teichoic acid export membrane protein